MIDILNFLQIIGAAGGGGSSSSSDGDGGAAGLVVVGYAITFPICSRYCKKYKKKHDEEAYAADKKRSWLVFFVAIIPLTIISICLGGIQLYFILAFPLILGALLGLVCGLYGLFERIKPNAEIKKKVSESATKDRMWDEQYLRNGANNIFMHYQQDWSNFSLDNMRAYMTPRYYEHVWLMLQEMRMMNRRNLVKIDNVYTIEITNMRDSDNNGEDRFVAGISADIVDRLVDMHNGNSVMVETNDSIDEFWHFARVGDQWMLDGITPSTASKWVVIDQIRDFAVKNGAFYSADWGRLLLPAHGQLFKRGSLTKSDVNNHVIGRLCDTGRTYSDGIIFQIYTYCEDPNSSTSKTYLIGQVTVPKYYGDILIRHKKGLFNFGIVGLTELTTEWNQFNEKFQVFASKPELVTSFELLNPQMMQWIEQAPFEINIEVIDNSIYFFSDVGGIKPDYYPTMLSILQAAYRELKL